MKKEKKIRVIGIGASTGGLKEFECFFKHMPAGKEVAFVIIQQLTPEEKSILAEMVKRYTEMDVFQVEEKVKVKAGKVYIIPPNKLLTISNGKLVIGPMQEEKGIHLPIDIFFRSLQDNLGEKAIAVLLSGTGSDGTLGIKEVKEAGGLTIVQQPKTADLDEIPSSAIITGFIDFIIPVEEMPTTILSYIENEFQEHKILQPTDTKVVSYINQIFNLIKQQIGQDFTHYKRNTILRRIERRLIVNKLDNLKDYVDFLKVNPKEIGILHKELLISVTSFFRDEQTFKYIEKNLIPKIVSQSENQTVRIWVPACATGEEAYSWAMLLKAYVVDNKLNHEIQIFASDIDVDAVEKARKGYYTNNIVADVPKEILERFFIEEKDGFTVEKSIRDSILFAEQNLIQDPPYSRLDAVSCRNLLIYLDNDLQQKAISIFHFALRPNCTMVLGNSESLGNSAQYFKVVDRKFKIFTKIDSIDITNRLWKIKDQRRENVIPVKKIVSQPIAALTKEFILDRYTPPSVVIDYDGEMLYIQGKTGKYLELSTGEVKNNIVKVAREGLKVPLLNTIRKVKTKKEEIVYRNIRVKTNEDFEHINLSISPLKKNNKDTGLLIVLFVPSVSFPQISVDTIESSTEYVTILELEKELAEKEQYLQNTMVELETTNEELKSSNEEAQSSNEELKSTNEELETSKEELQSVNEELSTTNNELILKIDELARVNNNLKNLLDATDIATIFLDRNMKIFSFTPSVSEIMDLLYTDIGRSIQQFTNNLSYDHLVHDTKQVLKTLIPIEKEVQLVNKNYFWMRIIPYLTMKNVVEGVVITFTNITEKKKQEAELEKYSKHLEELVEEKSKEIKESEALLNEAQKTAKIGGWQLDPETLKQTWTEEMFRILEIDLDHGTPELPKGMQFINPEFRPMADKAVQRAMELGEPYNQEWMATTAKGNKKWVNAVCNPKMKDGKVDSVSGSFQDITIRKQMEFEVKKARDKAQSYIDIAAVMIAVLNKQGEIEIINKKGCEILGYSNSDELIGLNWFEVCLRKEIKNEVHAVFKQLMNGEVEPFEYYENDVLTKSGNERIVAFHNTVLFDSDSKRTGVLFSGEDITERKRSEVELIKAKEQVEKEKERYLGLINNLDAGVVVHASDTSILICNERSTELLGLHEDQLKGKLAIDSQWKFIYEDKSPIPHNDYPVARILTSKKPIKNQILGVYRKTDDLVWLMVNGLPFTDNNKKISEVIISFIDITEQKKSEVKLIKAKEKAEESDRLKSGFLANMSHEIRTPMNGILGFSDLLREHDLSNEKQQQYIEIIKKSGNRMLNTVNDIIDISKIEAGLVELSVSEVNIDEHLKYLHSFFKPEAAKNGTQLLLKNGISKRDLKLKTDLEKFNSIVTNLLKNAIKFTSQGTIELGFYIKKENRSTEIEFYVKDTGSGISKDRLKAIFNRFVQADIEDKRALQGSGLGLAISKAYVEMLGGKIWIESELGKGSTFYFTLPYNTKSKEHKVIEKVNSKQNEKEQLDPEISGLKILIAEDDEASEKLIKIMFKKFAKEILIARNGIDAVEICKKNPDIDLILMDIQMPKLDGYKATRQIRNFNKEVVIIAQSAYALMGDKEKIIAAGCNDHVLKPINKDELLEIILRCF